MLRASSQWENLHQYDTWPSAFYSFALRLAPKSFKLKVENLFRSSYSKIALKKKQKVSTNSNIIIHWKDKIAIKLSYVLELFLSAFSFNTGPNEVGQAQLVQAPAIAGAECSI